MSESRIRLNAEGAGPFAKTFETNDGVEDVNAQAVVLTDGTTGAEKGTTANPLPVQGADAAGAALAGNPVPIAASDGANAQIPRVFDVDSGAGTEYALGVNLRRSANGGSAELLGQTTMAQSIPVTIASDQTAVRVQGNVADGAAVSGNPVLIAGQDGTNAQSILTDTSGRQVMVGAAAAGASPVGNPVLVAGWDSLNVQRMRVFNVSTSGTPDYVVGVSIRRGTASGSVEAGTPSSPFNVVIPRVSTGGTITTPIINQIEIGSNTGVTLTFAGGGTLVASGIYVQVSADGNVWESLYGYSSADDLTAVLLSGLTRSSGEAAISYWARVPPGARYARIMVVSVTSGSESYSLAAHSGPTAPLVQVVGGSDGATLRPLLMDTTGRQVMVGAAADGAAVAGNPVLIAGQDGANARSLLTDTTGRQVIVGAAADGAAVAGNPVLIAGQDGANAQSIKTNTTGQLETVSVGETSTGTLNNGAQTTVSSVAVSILAANANRKCAIIQNVGSNPIRVGVAAVTATTGIQLVAGATLILEPPYLPTGAVFAIREGASDSTAFTTEIV